VTLIDTAPDAVAVPAQVNAASWLLSWTVKPSAVAVAAPKAGCTAAAGVGAGVAAVRLALSVILTAALLLACAPHAVSVPEAGAVTEAPSVVERLPQFDTAFVLKVLPETSRMLVPCEPVQ
jgi:hypothetical protein